MDNVNAQPVNDLTPAATQSNKPFHEAVAEKIIAQLEQGTAPWITPWKSGDGGGMLPFNPTTGKRYKGINGIHLLSQGRTDQRWLTYKQAAAVGAFVRKGEKSTPVQYWKFEEEQTKRDENNKPVLDGNGKPVKVRVRLERPKMFMARVFNAEQIEGLPEYQRPIQSWNAIERAETILAASGATIVHGGDQAFYRPSTDKIHSPNRDQFPTAQAYYATQLHELGHWTGHPSRLDRDLSHPFGSEGYAKEELRAEIASMILGAELGIGHDPGQHVSYVASWIKALKEDPLEIFRAAADAEKIQTFVLGLEQQLIQTQEQPQPVPVPESWTGPACEIFDEEMAARIGDPTYSRAKKLASDLATYDEMSFEPSPKEQQYLDERQDAIVEAKQWVRENVLLNPVVKERMYETVRDLGRYAGDIDADKELRDYLAEMEGRSAQVESNEQGVAMQIPAPQPNTQAEEWALRAIERTDLDQVVRRMTGEQLMTFNQVLESMKPLSNDNDFWTRREEAMEEMFNDVDTVDDRIQRAGEIIGDEVQRRIDVALREQPDENVTAEQALADQLSDSAVVQQGYIDASDNDAAAVHREEAGIDASAAAVSPEGESLSTSEQMVVTALVNVRSEPNTELKASFGRLFESTSGQVLGYELPSDWLGETQVAGIATDPDGESVSMVSGDQVPEFYGLYARDKNGNAVWLADYASEAEAQVEAARLAKIHSHAQVGSATNDQAAEYDPDLVQEMMMYETRIEELQSAIKKHIAEGDSVNADFLTFGHPVDPIGGSLNENLSNLRECQKKAGITERETLRFEGDFRDGDRIEPNAQAWYDDWWERKSEGFPEDDIKLELSRYPQEGEQWTFNSKGQHVIFVPPRNQEQTQHQSQAVTGKQSQATDRTYIDVPFKEKEQVRELGAKWDRQEKSWYIVPGADHEPFTQWLTPRAEEPQVIPDAAQAAPEVEVTASQEKATVDGQKPAVLKPGRQYLAVPYGERAAARAAGAAWDKAAKSWYVGPDGDSKALARWNPENVRNEQLPAQTLEEEFADAMRAVGLVPDTYKGDKHPILDGKKHRVPVEGGRNGARDGFYVGFTDGHPAGFIGNNKTGVGINWKSKGYSLSAEEKALLAAQAAANTQARDAELLKTHLAVAERVTAGIKDLVQVGSPTPYLQAKNIAATPGVLTDPAGQQTVIPAMDAAGKIWTAQYIQKDGTKRFAKEGRKEGCFHPLGGLKALAAAPAIVIAEGYATASSLAGALEFGTVAAFDSGNLLPVAKALHEMFPNKPVIVAGDEDAHLLLTHGVNVGRSKAQEAAKAVGGSAIFPLFTPAEVFYPTDLPPVTPQAYRTHLAAVSAYKDLINKEGADVRQSERAIELKAEMLSDAQLAALEKMKRLTDFNDLGAKCASGQERLLRQVKNSVNLLIEQHQVKAVAAQEVNKQGVGLEDQLRRARSVGGM